MLPILAIDTCLGAVSAALCWQEAGGRRRTEHTFELCRGGHAERLLPMVGDLLAVAGLQARHVRRVAVTLGPGTFTGVRTGVAAARAFALASGAEIVGTTSLHAMALQVAADPAPGQVATGIVIAADARKGQAFVQTFAPDGAVAGAPTLLTYAEAAADMQGGRWRLAGSGAEAVRSAATAVGVQIMDCDAALEPDARALLEVAQTLAPLTTVMPLYIRPPDALPQAGKSLPRAGT